MTVKAPQDSLAFCFLCLFLFSSLIACQAVSPYLHPICLGSFLILANYIPVKQTNNSENIIENKINWKYFKILSLGENAMHFYKIMSKNGCKIKFTICYCRLCLIFPFFIFIFIFSWWLKIVVSKITIFSPAQLFFCGVFLNWIHRFPQAGSFNSK